MKKIIGLCLAFLLAPSALAETYAHALYFQKLNSTEDNWQNVWVTALPDFAEGLMRYNTVTNNPEWIKRGPRLQIDVNNVLDSVQPDWNASSSAPAAINNKPIAPVIGSPINRTLALATAYRCTDITRPCKITITLQSTSSVSITSALALSGSTANEASFILGSTSAVASGTGTVMALYKNTVSATLIVGASVNDLNAQATTIEIPAGWYVAVRQTAGSGITIPVAVEQAWSI